MDFRSKTALLFDLDGTVIDSAPGIIRSAQYALRKFGREMDEESLRAFIGPPLEQCFTEVCGLPEELAAEAVQYYRERYGVTGKFECSIYPGVAELLARLHEAGKKVLLATSKPEQFAVEILEHLGVARYFDRIGGATFDSSRSSKEDVLRYVLGFDGGIAPEDAVMIGDRKYDVIGAKAHGIASIGVLYGFGDRPELEAAGADCIVKTAEELAGLLGCSPEGEIPLTEVYLVRHAEPDKQVHEDAIRPLTPKGMADREKVTALLWEQGIDAVYASPYRRAMDTIRDFAEKKGLPITEVWDFREREMGSEWVTDEEFLRLRRRQWDDFSFSYGDGESLGHVQERVQRAMEKLLAGERGKRVAIAGHGTAFSVLLHSYDPAFGHDDCVRICRRLPWVVKMTFRGNELLTWEELL